MDKDVGQNRFLVTDDLPAPHREQILDQLRHGRVYVQRFHTLEDDHSIRVPNGLIHHWVAIVFIPNATLADAVAVLRDYNHQQDFYKPLVRSSQLIEQNGNESKIFLQFVNSAGASVVVDANFDVKDTPLGETRYEIASRSTRIAELTHPGQPDEHELPVGKDHGYMWRLYSYWTIEQSDGGVYIQNESIELSRSIPPIISWFVKPFVESIPRDVLTSLLTNTREEVIRRETSRQ